MFVNRSGQNEPSIDASYQVPVPFGRGVSEEKIKM